MRALRYTALLTLLLVQLVSTQERGRITRIEFRPATSEEGGGVFITLAGSGSCSYTLDYGDGQTERRGNITLPDRVHHAYAADGEYTVVATPEAPCEGVARAKLDVRAINRGVWHLSVEPGVAVPDGIEVAITVHGRGDCVVTLDYGDGTPAEKLEGALPATRTHKYAKAGTYEVKAVTAEPCRGEASLRVEIARGSAERGRQIPPHPGGNQRK